MKKYGGKKSGHFVQENNHDPRGNKCYRGTKSHERFEAKKQITKEVSNEIIY